MDLGPVPGIAGNYGGVAFDPARPDELLIGLNAFYLDVGAPRGWSATAGLQLRVR